MGTRGTQCETLSLTSRMQRLCVESWTVGLLYRCWEQLLLTKEWTEEIQCRGEETIIRLCPTSKDIQYLQDNCVGLICSGKMSQFILSVMQSNLTFKSLNIYLNRIVVSPFLTSILL